MIAQLTNILGTNRVKANVVLAPYTSFKLGGPAEYYFEALTRNDLVKAYEASQRYGLKLTILGGGSNVMIAQKGIAGLVVRNLYKEKEILDDQNNAVVLRVSSGYPVTSLVYETVDAGFSGLEYHLGLPGTVGGAIYMNSKWTKPVAYVGDQVVEAELIGSDGTVKTVNQAYFQFAYDFSILQKTHEILLTVAFRLKKESKEEVKKRAEETLKQRKNTQPFGVFSSGCFFKNLNGKSVGQLIDELGLKGFSVGNFSVSDKHGNFIIHKGDGKREDLEQLLSVIKSKVKAEYGVELEEEVVFI